MRIVWICGAQVVGGAEQVTFPIVAGLQRRGHTVSIICPTGGALRTELERRRLDHQPLVIGAKTPWACRALAHALDELAPDVAMVTTSPEWMTTTLAPRPAATRLVLVRHMTLPLSWWIRRLIALRADAVIAVSNAVRQSLESGVPASRLHVIHNPVRFAPRLDPPTAEERAHARQALGLTGAGHWVGFFGGVHEAKGVRDVLDAVRAANRPGETTHLLLCGRTDARMPPLAALASERGLAGQVHYLGEIDRMVEAHTAVDVVIMATHTRLSEALPATIAEAMACGTPVLAYATGGMAELIGSDGAAGRLAQPDDAQDLARVLREMLSDAPGGDDLARRGLQRIRTLCDPKRAVDRYEQLFTALATRTGNDAS